MPNIKSCLVAPRGKLILDTCRGLGYFAAWCLRGQAAHVYSYENNPDVVWLRSLNPWSPDNRWLPEGADALTLTTADVCQQIATLQRESVDAILHDPPRFGIAGELYSQVFSTSWRGFSGAAASCFITPAALIS